MALEQMDAWLAGKSLEALGPVTRIGLDGFPLLENSELAEEHALVTEYIEQHAPKGWRDVGKSAGDVTASREMLARKAPAITRCFQAMLERVFAFEARLSEPADMLGYVFGPGAFPQTMAALYAKADKSRLRPSLLRWLALHRNFACSMPLVDAVVEDLRKRPPSTDERMDLVSLRCQFADQDSRGFKPQTLQAMDEVLGPGGWWSVLAPVEVWAREAIHQLTSLALPLQRAWRELLLHCGGATSAKPSTRWSMAASPLIEAVGREEFRRRFCDWASRFDAARTTKMLSAYWEKGDDSQRVHERNADVLRGLLWLCPPLADTEVIRAIRVIAVSAYRKIRGLGPRAVKVGNAALSALGAIGTVDAVGQMAMLKARVRFGTAQKGIEKALNVAAQKVGIPRPELEELAVPEYGLSDVGRRVEKLDQFTAEQTVRGNRVELRWFDARGKVHNTVPGSVREEFAEELKELKSAAKDIERMIPAQAARIEASFLARKAWPLARWRTCYLDHPLVGILARRLIWRAGPLTFLATDGVPRDAEGRELALPDQCNISLWHPLGATEREVQAWRNRLEAAQIRQPFKQAHRELYVLTDAERRTVVYSNRFAAHIVKQHQFNTLVAARGWKHKLRLMVDDSYPPAHIEYPDWGLRAEFWVEGAGTEYGRDTNESGAFLYLATDQVRFYRTGAAPNEAPATGGGYTTRGADAPENHPVALADIPPLLLSEVLRDVDLFVGVASVANDPNWSDGGPQGRYREYWSHCALGDLSASAQIRKQVLERLVPKLKIASKCRFEDRWLVVTGSLRTYRIHLGSGNILMKPDDQYLCIVPRQSAVESDAEMFLPFEGDRMLSVILSKAFLLAADARISDPTILSQIQR